MRATLKTARPAFFISMLALFSMLYLFGISYAVITHSPGGGGNCVPNANGCTITNSVTITTSGYGPFALGGGFSSTPSPVSVTPVTSNVMLYNQGSSQWLITCPTAPDPSNTYDYITPQPTPFVGGDGCQASSNPLSSIANFQTVVSWSSTSLASSTAALSFSNIGQLKVDNLAYSGESYNSTKSIGSANVSNGYNSYSNIFTGVPPSTQRGIWSWNSKIADISNPSVSGLSDSGSVGPLYVYNGICNYAYQYIVLANVITSNNIAVPIPIAPAPTGDYLAFNNQTYPGVNVGIPPDLNTPTFSPNAIEMQQCLLPNFWGGWRLVGTGGVLNYLSSTSYDQCVYQYQNTPYYWTNYGSSGSPQAVWVQSNTLTLGSSYQVPAFLYNVTVPAVYSSISGAFSFYNSSSYLYSYHNVQTPGNSIDSFPVHGSQGIFINENGILAELSSSSFFGGSSYQGGTMPPGLSTQASNVIAPEPGTGYSVTSITNPLFVSEANNNNLFVIGNPGTTLYDVQLIPSGEYNLSALSPLAAASNYVGTQQGYNSILDSYWASAVAAQSGQMYVAKEYNLGSLFPSPPIGMASDYAGDTFVVGANVVARTCPSTSTNHNCPPGYQNAGGTGFNILYVSANGQALTENVVSGPGICIGSGCSGGGGTPLIRQFGSDIYPEPYTCPLTSSTPNGACYTAAQPLSIAVSPSGQYLFIAEQNLSYVLVYSVAISNSLLNVSFISDINMSYSTKNYNFSIDQYLLNGGPYNSSDLKQWAKSYLYQPTSPNACLVDYNDTFGVPTNPQCGNPALSYQWYIGPVSTSPPSYGYGPGSTCSSTDIPLPSISPGQTYTASPASTTTYCVQTTEQQQTYASQTTITVQPTPTGNSISPSFATIVNGQSITLTAVSSGPTTGYTYMWYVDTADNYGCYSGNLNLINGATSATYTTPSLSTVNSYPTEYMYVVYVFGPGGSADCQQSTIMVQNPDTQITASPLSQYYTGTAVMPTTIDNGQSITLSAVENFGGGYTGSIDSIYHKPLGLAVSGSTLYVLDNWLFAPYTNTGSNPPGRSTDAMLMLRAFYFNGTEIPIHASTLPDVNSRPNGITLTTGYVADRLYPPYGWPLSANFTLDWTGPSQTPSPFINYCAYYCNNTPDYTSDPLGANVIYGGYPPIGPSIAALNTFTSPAYSAPSPLSFLSDFNNTLYLNAWAIWEDQQTGGTKLCGPGSQVLPGSYGVPPGGDYACQIYTELLAVHANVDNYTKTSNASSSPPYGCYNVVGGGQQCGYLNNNYLINNGIAPNPSSYTCYLGINPATAASVAVPAEAPPGSTVPVPTPCTIVANLSLQAPPAIGMPDSFAYVESLGSADNYLSPPNLAVAYASSGGGGGSGGGGNANFCLPGACPTLTFTPSGAVLGDTINVIATCQGGDICAVDYPKLGTQVGTTGTSTTPATYQVNTAGLTSFTFYASDTSGTYAGNWVSGDPFQSTSQNSIANVVANAENTIPGASIPSQFLTPSYLKSEIAGSLLVPYTYTYTLTQQWCAPSTSGAEMGMGTGMGTACSTSDPSITPNSVDPGCAANTLILPGKSSSTFSVYTAQPVYSPSVLNETIQGGPTVSQYQNWFKYYMANLSDQNLLSPPQIYLNIFTNRIFGEVYINQSVSPTGLLISPGSSTEGPATNWNTQLSIPGQTLSLNPPLPVPTLAANPTVTAQYNPDSQAPDLITITSNDLGIYSPGPPAGYTCYIYSYTLTMNSVSTGATALQMTEPCQPVSYPATSAGIPYGQAQYLFPLCSQGSTYTTCPPVGSYNVQVCANYLGSSTPACAAYPSSDVFTVVAPTTPTVPTPLIINATHIFDYAQVNFLQSTPLGPMPGFSAEEYIPPGPAPPSVHINPTNALNSSWVVEYTGTNSLLGDVFAQSITIDPGAVLTTNGHSLVATGTLTNLGTIIAGNPNDGGIYGGSGYPYQLSYGGSGGGPASGSSFGGNTLVPGGGLGQSGSSPAAPSPVTSSMLNLWAYASPFYLTGAGGASNSVSGGGGSGSYGLYLQGDALDLAGGTIMFNGIPGGPGGGGGGGGVLALAYGPGGYTAGTYNPNGGAGNGGGGSGGPGGVITFQYPNDGPQPVVIPPSVNSPVYGAACTFCTDKPYYYSLGSPVSTNCKYANIFCANSVYSSAFSSQPSILELFDALKAETSLISLQLNLICPQHANCGSSVLGYNRFNYTYVDTFNNVINMPLDINLANVTTINLNVVTSLAAGNPNQTQISVSGTAGYYPSIFSVTPVPVPAGSDIYLYYDTNINFFNTTSTLAPLQSGFDTQQYNPAPQYTNPPSNAYKYAEYCAFAQGAGCVLANPVFTTNLPVGQGPLGPFEANVIDYNPQYNSIGQCSLEPNSLLLATGSNFNCNIYGNFGLPSSGNTLPQPDGQTYPEYCIPDFPNGTGTLTSQLGLVTIAQTNGGYFSNTFTACGTGTARVIATYYGAPPGQPVVILQPSLQSPSIASAGLAPFPYQVTYQGAPYTISTRAPMLYTTEFNYSISPNSSTVSFPQGTYYLQFGDIAGWLALLLVGSISGYILLRSWLPTKS